MRAQKVRRRGCCDLFRLRILKARISCGMVASYDFTRFVQKGINTSGIIPLKEFIFIVLYPFFIFFSKYNCF